MTDSKKTHKINYYTKEQGSPGYRRKHTLEIDSFMNLVNYQETDEVELDPSSEDYAEIKKQQLMKDRGLDSNAGGIENSTYIISENAQNELQIDDYQKMLFQFFVDSFNCWFDGCEKLRDEYKQEIEKAGGEKNCPGCTKGAIKRKYLELIKTEYYTKEQYEEEKNSK